MLKNEGIRYGYVDVLADLARFKKFLNLRDARHDKELAKTVENGKAGIPCFLVDDEVLYVGLPEDLDLLR